MEGYQQGGGVGRMGEKVHGIRIINGRYKIDRDRLRIIQEMEKPKNLHSYLYARPVSYTHLTLPTIGMLCRSRWSPYH